MANMPQNPLVLAYSGVGNPIKTYNAYNSFTNSHVASKTDTLSFNISQNGTIQSFLANVNVTSLGGTSIGGLFKVTLKRNGAVLHSSTFDLQLTLAASGTYCGSIYYETLNFLAGAEVYNGETFEMELKETGGDGATVFTFEAQFNMAVLSKSSQLVL